MTRELTDDYTLAADRTTTIVSAYLSHSTMSRDEVPAFIGKVFEAVRSMGSAPVPEPVPEQRPAVPINKSITPDFIVCLEDGKKFKSLKRHLRTHYNLSPEAYREKWRLPIDYPMVAPNYSVRRSDLAKKSGLGTKGVSR